MAKKKKKTGSRTYTPNLSPERYGKYLTALIEGEEAAKHGRVFWDCGPGERPQHVLADFRHVARKEQLEVRIELDKSSGQSLVFIYAAPGIATTEVRVRRKDGTLKK